ncbi:hypothetical protein [Amorphus coralli]|uniref:hypothetical protein n=1 Tax=Amorphus coralli TaxID=340680 RepID=UPI00040843D3|nr:hypothetical protein [Amorphus coralli]
MNTARYRCNACGEPLVRPVLSCPYCGAFRSAISLEDGTLALPPEAEAEGDAPQARPDDVIYVDAELHGAESEPHDDAYEPDEPAIVPPPPRAEPAARRIRRDRSRLDAAPGGAAHGEPVEPTAAPSAEPRRAEPQAPGRRRRAEPSIGRRGSRLDRAASREPGLDEGEMEAASVETPTAMPREPAAPRAPGGRRRAGPKVARRRARAERSEEEAWIVPDGDESPDPSIDDVMRDAEGARGRRSDGRALVPVSDEEAGVPAEYRERRRKGARAGWIVFVVVLLALGAGLVYGAYWVDKQGIADLLRAGPIQVSRLGEAETLEVPGEWTSVPDPNAGNAIALLVDASGPFRMRVDGTVYTLTGAEAVRVPVKDGTLVELKALEGPVTAEVTRLGEDAGS